MLLVGEAVDGVDARLDARGALEVQLGRRLLHLGLQLVDELAVLARQEALDALDVDAVVLGRDAAAAGAGAQAHVRVEARAGIVRHERERILLQTALELAPVGARRGAQGHDAPGDVHHVAGGAAVGVGAEVLGVRAVLLARVLDGGEHIALRERDERVGLVVLEVGVEERRVLVDEVLLQHERLVLVLHHDVVEAVDLVDQQRDLRALVLEVHVLAHAGAQLLGLAHVDDLAGFVLPKVHSRQRGHAVQLFLDALELGALAGFGARGVGVVLARGTFERWPAATFPFEALVVAKLPRIERGVARQALDAARIGHAERGVRRSRPVARRGSVVGCGSVSGRRSPVECEKPFVERALALSGFVEIVHAASIANRTSVPLSADSLHAVCKRDGCGRLFSPSAPPKNPVGKRQGVPLSAIRMRQLVIHTNGCFT